MSKNKQFNHFVFTRFNIRTQWKKNIRYVGLDEEWLSKRFDLFEAVCLPLMARQTQKSFQWLIFLNEETPDKFVRRMSDWCAKYPFMVPIYMKVEDQEQILDEMNRRSVPGCLRIMTRLDNDDAVHPRMIESIQKMAKKYCGSNDLERGFFISFPIGYSENNGDYYLQRFRYNAFNSFVSVPEHNRIIYYWNHTKVADAAPVYLSYTRPMWCQGIHDENVTNTIRGIYFPWGQRSVFAAGRRISSHSFAWKCGELWRSFRSYVLRK